MAKSVTQSERYATSGDRREGFRKEVGKQSSVRFTEVRAELIVEVRDISASGCRIASGRPLPLGTEVIVGLGGAGSVKGRIVNQRQNDYGIEFACALGPETLGAAFSGTQVITLFAAHETDQGNEEYEYSNRGKVAIIASLTIISWLSAIGMASFAQRILS